MERKSVFDPEFVPYGQVHERYELSGPNIDIASEI